MTRLRVRRGLGVATVLIVGCALFVFGGTARAGTAGGITGTIRDAATSEPIGLATVTIPELKRGATTDAQGHYFILNLLPGKYTVRVALLGYIPQVREGVEVFPDFNAKVDFTMTSTVLKDVQEVQVKGERPLIQKDVTTTTKFLNGDEIKNQPLRGYQEAVAQQAGVVSFNLNNLNQVSAGTEIQNSNTLIIRGGRPNEVAYYVDGFSQQDPLTGFSTTSIANDAIDEVVVQSGGFNAEYGRINSGIVNVVTREGGDRYAGSVEGQLGDYLDRRGDHTILAASLGGPITPKFKNLTFFLSGEHQNIDDRKPSFITDELFLPQQPGVFEDGVLPANDSESWATAAKMAYKLSPTKTIRVGGTYNKDDWRQFLSSYRFNLAHSPRYKDENWSAFGSWNHTVNNRSFYELRANMFSTERIRGDGIYFDDLRGYARPEGNPSFDDLALYWNGDDPATGADESHVWNDLLHRKSSYWGMAANYTNQVTQKLQLKAGGDFQRHTLRYFDHYTPTQAFDKNGNPDNVIDVDHYGYDALGNELNDGDTFTDTNGNNSYDEGEPFNDLNGNGIYDDPLDAAKHPKVASAYVQGKFEQLGLVVNAGLRWDYLTPATHALKSETLPLGPEFGGVDTTNNPTTLDPTDLEDSKVYQRLSPRLGIGFPVTDQTLLHVNYGQFFQQPNLQDLYASYTFLEYKINNGGYFVGFGNPNLKPEETTAYELGIQHTPNERSRIDATIYYKDVKDLVEIVTIRSSPNAFSSYRNTDFATIKGLDLAYTMRRTGHVSMNAAYSLSWARGTGSISQSQRTIAWTAQEPPKLATPLSFDQRHRFTLNFDYRFGAGEGPTWGGTRWLENTGINVLFNAASGTPYTPTKVYNAVTLGATFPTPTGEINSQYGPWTATADLKASKAFGIGRGQNIEAYVLVKNITNRKNVYAVYTATGSAESTNYLNTDAGQAAFSTPEDQELYHAAELNPDYFGNPRQVRFGARLSF
ncbi:MAG TPA: TonB-dependent receptor [Candidatus Eisenbacteria bacterium]|nr:TonB-dependent receptor [Candidatus Eisenbacteria bacterium]